ncbi:MAG: hypothetical protein KAU31_12835 [Spirochaetaceae bacterium]|nr:hypothetical protein [Spirochaetaceae bacterium]
MTNRHRSTIQVYPVSDSRDQYIAVFASEFLGATFAVMFPETITGAVALHTFAEMIRKQYGPAVDIIIPDGLSLPKDSPVRDILSEIRRPLFVHDDP